MAFVASMVMSEAAPEPLTCAPKVELDRAAGSSGGFAPRASEVSRKNIGRTTFWVAVSEASRCLSVSSRSAAEENSVSN